MPIADIIRLGAVRLTTQQIADMALVEDQARRAATNRGDASAAADHDREIVKLATILGN